MMAIANMDPIGHCVTPKKCLHIGLKSFRILWDFWWFLGFSKARGWSWVALVASAAGRPPRWQRWLPWPDARRSCPAPRGRRLDFEQTCGWKTCTTRILNTVHQVDSSCTLKQFKTCDSPILKKSISSWDYLNYFESTWYVYSQWSYQHRSSFCQALDLLCVGLPRFRRSAEDRSGVSALALFSLFFCINLKYTLRMHHHGESENRGILLYPKVAEWKIKLISPWFWIVENRQGTSNCTIQTRPSKKYRK